jgi:diguanylate cyclase (GGDEF)-like protein
MPKILIVNDTAADLAVLRTTFSDLEADLVEASSGSQALELVEENHFALIVLDVDLSETDCFQIAEDINSSRSRPVVPIILTGTAQQDQDHLRRGYQAGAVDYIMKPVDTDFLLSKAKVFVQLDNHKAELETRVEERTAELRRSQKFSRVGGWKVNLEDDTYQICQTAYELFFSHADHQIVTHGSRGTFLSLLPRSERTRVADILLDAGENNLCEIEFEFKYFNADSEPCIAISCASLAYQDGKLVEIQGVVQDVTERKETEGKLHHVASHDVLTGLPNRHLFRDRLEQAFLRVERTDRFVAIMMIDIYHFKDVNDKFGHPVGDALLEQVASRLTTVARASDTVARLGGDEFAIILTELDNAANIDVIARRCIEALDRVFVVDGHQIQSGCNIGISCYPNDGISADDLIKHSGLALDQSKASGCGDYRLYNDEMSNSIIARRDREERINIAFHQNEFELYFQPKINLKTRGVVGVEALIRWNHPLQGLVSPDEFIPLAEQIGLIHELGEWVIESACKTATRWHSIYGDKLKLAVNVSAVQMCSEDFGQRVERILEKEQTPGELLEIEITESSILEDPHKTGLTLDALRLLGITIALDDFGTGYSSLTHLKYLRASTLKIDRSFINNIMDDQYDQHIAEKMIELAQKLNMEVVAEGIETQDQMDRLLECGCDIGQGYLFSRPLCEADFLAWLTEYEADLAASSPVSITDKSTSV